MKAFATQDPLGPHKIVALALKDGVKGGQAIRPTQVSHIHLLNIDLVANGDKPIRQLAKHGWAQ